VPATRASWGRCATCAVPCHVKCIDRHDRAFHPELVADQDADALLRLARSEHMESPAEIDARYARMVSFGFWGARTIVGGGVLVVASVVMLFERRLPIGIPVFLVGLALIFLGYRAAGWGGVGRRRRS
jgi:hypothetical protein